MFHCAISIHSEIFYLNLVELSMIIFWNKEKGPFLFCHNLSMLIVYHSCRREVYCLSHSKISDKHQSYGPTFQGLQALSSSLSVLGEFLGTKATSARIICWWRSEFGLTDGSGFNGIGGGLGWPREYLNASILLWLKYSAKFAGCLYTFPGGDIKSGEWDDWWWILEWDTVTSDGGADSRFLIQ